MTTGNLVPVTANNAHKADLTPFLIVMAACLLLLQRFWLFAKVPWSLPIVAGALMAAYYRGFVVIQTERLLAFLLFGAFALAAALANGWLGNFFSPTSIAYLLVTYSFFILIPAATIDRARLLELWQNLSLLAALLGVLQFAVFLTARQVLDLSPLLPSFLLDNPGYNTVHFDPTHTFLRANGIVFLEASFFSQFMALALVIEAAISRNPYRFACFMVALLCALSGTGILMVGVAVLAGGVTHRDWLSKRHVLLFTGGAAAAAFLLLLVPPLRDYFGERLVSSLTFETRDTSSYIRFVAPWAALYEMGVLGMGKVLAGLGPGWFTLAKLQMPISPNPHPVSQMGLYYGIFATIAYVIFLWTVTIAPYTRAQWVVMTTVLFQYLFCAGNLLAPYVVYVLLWFGFVFYPSPTIAKTHA